MSDPWDTGLQPPPEFSTVVPSGRVLCFAPHPDDEAAGPGGALCLHRQQGDEVRVVVTTDGSAGDPDGRYDPEQYKNLRQDESRQGLRELGVDDVTFWPYPDNARYSEDDIELGVQTALAEIESYGPATIYLPWEGEGHPDHHAVYVLLTRAMDRAKFAGRALGFEVWNAMVPDLILDITGVMERKQRAMLCHKSQIEYVQYDHCMMGLNAYRSLVHKHGRGYCEAYRVIR